MSAYRNVEEIINGLKPNTKYIKEYHKRYYQEHKRG